MSNSTEESKIQRGTLPGSRIDDEMVFFDLNSGNYFGTGAVGTKIWEYLETPRSFEEICEHLLEFFDVDRAVCESDVKSFLADMMREKIVQPA